MVLSTKSVPSKMNEFFSIAIQTTLSKLLKPDDAYYLTRALISKQSKEELLSFLENPIIVVDGENDVLIDNKFIRRKLIENNQFDILEKINSSKIIVSNSNNVSIIGLNVIYLMGSTVRLISPAEDEVLKSDIFIAKNNKVINTINANIHFSVGNSFKNLMHSTIENMKNTRIVNVSKTSTIPKLPEFSAQFDRVARA